LNTVVAPSGANLSVGQRQLICMGRALLKNCQVLILDEATASVDNETDQIIQGTLLKEFAGRTVIVIAHRLQSVMQMDHIVVMDSGTVAQQGRPWELLQNRHGAFSQMVDQTGSASSKYLRAMALEAYSRQEHPVAQDLSD